jgi:hypothetical protein
MGRRHRWKVNTDWKALAYLCLQYPIERTENGKWRLGNLVRCDVLLAFWAHSEYPRASDQLLHLQLSNVEPTTARFMRPKLLLVRSRLPGNVHGVPIWLDRTPLAQ